MTMAELRSATEWLNILDQAKDWRDGFEQTRVKKHPFVSFGEINATSRLDGMGESLGWEGTLIVPKALSIEMMAWLEKRALDELKKLGVTP